MAAAKILPRMGRGTIRRMVEGTLPQAPCPLRVPTTTLRAVPLPRRGRNWRSYHQPVMLNSFQHPSCLTKRMARVEKWTLNQVQGDEL